MGMAAYTPTDDAMPVGRCTSCHMAKTPKSGGWTTSEFTDGGVTYKALRAGDQASHVFDVIWPSASAALDKPGASYGDIMPNACGGCHDGSLIYFLQP